jgi:hypothetical protein
VRLCSCNKLAVYTRSLPVRRRRRRIYRVCTFIAPGTYGYAHVISYSKGVRLSSRRSRATSARLSVSVFMLMRDQVFYILVHILCLCVCVCACVSIVYSACVCVYAYTKTCRNWLSKNANSCRRVHFIRSGACRVAAAVLFHYSSHGWPRSRRSGTNYCRTGHIDNLVWPVCTRVIFTSSSVVFHICASVFNIVDWNRGRRWYLYVPLRTIYVQYIII